LSHEPETRERLEKLGFELTGSVPAELEAYLEHYEERRAGAGAELRASSRGPTGRDGVVIELVGRDAEFLE